MKKPPNVLPERLRMLRARDRLSQDQVAERIGKSQNAIGTWERGESHGISEMSSEALALRPGDPLKLIWIRPGTGRMEGAAVAMEPRPMPSSIESVAVPMPMRTIHFGDGKFNRTEPAPDPLVRSR